MTVHQYATPLAFKQAPEQRPRSPSATGTDFARRRQLLVFDRFFYLSLSPFLCHA